jgi:hypothetical protein
MLFFRVSLKPARCLSRTGFGNEERVILTNSQQALEKETCPERSLKFFAGSLTNLLVSFDLDARHSWVIIGISLWE